MHVTFGLELDSHCWPHALSGRPARLGHLYAGPMRLLEQLELHLGLLGRPCAHALRVALYAERLAAADGEKRFFHRSLERDRWGTARAILAWRDELVAAGWNACALHDGGPRLHDLAAVEAVATPVLLPGPAERLRAVLAALPATTAPPDAIRRVSPNWAVESVDLVDPLEELPPAWQDIFRAMEAAGVPVKLLPPPPAPSQPATDLERLQHVLVHPDAPAARPTGDGTFMHLHGGDPWKVAEALAGFLAANPGDPRQTVVVRGGAADTLDDALRSRHLPALGSSRRSPWRPATQVLPLAFALAWKPLDPYALLEMLTLAVKPLPGPASSALARVLRECPGIGGEQWKRAWEEAITAAGVRARSEAEKAGQDAATAQAAGQAEAHQVRKRLEQWLDPARVAVHSPSEGIPLQAARQLTADVTAWAQGRLQMMLDDGREPDPVLMAARDQATEVSRILEVWNAPRLPRAQVEQILEHVRGTGTAAFSTAGEVGRMQAVDAPGAVHGPAPTVIWWHFVASADAAPSRPPWTQGERRALGEAGVRLPQPEAAILGSARRWRQPILHATRRLILVSPDAALGQSLRVHPVHDEIRSRFCPSAADEARVTRTVEHVLQGHLFPGDWRPAVEQVPVRAPALPSSSWALPRSQSIARTIESSSSIECLLGCPLKWVLRHAASLAPGTLAGLAEGNRLAGILAHAVFQDLLQPNEPLLAGDEATLRATRAFEERLPTQGAPLLHPSRVVQKGEVGTTIARGARTLLEALAKDRLEVVGTEKPCDAPFEDGTLVGFIDVLLRRSDGSPAVIDLKYSGARYRREQLAKGRAVQLATYAQVARDPAGGTPPVAFFMIREAEMLTPDPHAFPSATAVAGPGMDATWERALAARDAIRADLRQGVVKVAAWDDSAAGLPLQLDAPCSFCDYGILCGLRGDE